MRTSFELLDEGVRVIVDSQIEGMMLGTSSYLISYGEFKKLMENAKSSNSTMNSEVHELNRVWGSNNELRMPKGTIEVKVIGGGRLHIRQMVAGNGFPVLNVVNEGFLDTSRYIIDFTINKQDMVVGDIEVSVFKGMVYGFHKPEHIIHNRFLTLKMKRDFEGKRFERLMDIDTVKRLGVITQEDINRQKSDTFLNEVARVKLDGGAIRWEEVQC